MVYIRLIITISMEIRAFSMGEDQTVKVFRGRLAGFFFLRYMLSCLVFGAFTGGIAVLAIRVLLGTSLKAETGLMIAGGVFLVMLAYAFIRMLKNLPSIQTLRTVFDKTNYCGGLLMASSEIEIGSWTQSIASIQSPRIRWNGRRSGGIFLLSVAFLCISFLVPQRFITAHAAGRLEIDDQTRQLHEQIEVLEEENIITEETAEDIQQKVEHIDETASSGDPVKTWEALGHLQDQLKKAAEEASVGMLAETEELTRTEMLTQALNQLAAELDQQTLEAAMSELAQMAQTLLEQNEAFKDALSEQLAEALKQGQLSPEQLQELMEALQGRKAELAECMARLCQAELAEMKLLKMCQEAGQCNAEGLKTMLGQCEGSLEAKKMFGIMKNSSDWGINRGRGDAPMAWSDPSSEEGTSFKEQVLPPASAAALKDAELMGVSVSAPSSEEGQEHLLSGDLSAAEAGGGQAVKRTILPKHKAAVKDYFQRDGK